MRWRALLFLALFRLSPSGQTSQCTTTFPVTVEFRKKDFETSANLPILSDHLVCSSACWSSSLTSPKGPDAESALVPLYVGTPAVASHLIHNILRCREKCDENSLDANVVRLDLWERRAKLLSR